MAVAGLAAIAALAACQNEKPAATPGASASAGASAQVQASAADALTAAGAKFKDTTVKMKMGMSGAAGIEVTGSLDGPGKKSLSSMKMGVAGTNMTIDVVQIGDEVWMKMAGVPTLPKDWMHVDTAKLGAASSLRTSIEDPSYSANLLKVASSVEWDGTSKIKGTLDLSKAAGANAAAATALGEQAKAVPFTATLDEQGRLLTMTVGMGQVAPAAGVGDMVITYSNYGEPVTIDKPSGKIVEAPASILGSL
ncbi:hypothetical protein CS0771_35400 [Catellatospora sp. IY07-71]|nr:hypothetical protein CS0771_35400 [Catellatospora sp. IY07-71]